MKKIAFIGGGHIAQAIAQGFIKGGIDPSIIAIANPTLGKLTRFSKKTMVHTTTDNRSAVQNADIVFITVRPSVVKHVIDEIKESITSGMIIVSVAACVDFSLLSRYFGKKKRKLIRIMPNIPVEQGKGVIGLITNSSVTSKEKRRTENLLSSIGVVVECNSESMLDKLSLLSGCGPGVIAYLIDILKEEARHLRFSETDAENIAIKTFSGTVAHLINQSITPHKLITQVATPGGITEKIIKSLSARYPLLLRKSLMKGYDRITSTTKELKEIS